MRLPIYKRPYCKSCRTIYGAQSIGRVFKCNVGHPLILKSFNPWPRVLYGCGFVAGSVATMAIPHMPVAWIGGILFAPIYVFNGFKQWLRIKKLDAGAKVSVTLSLAARLRIFVRRLLVARTLASNTIFCGGCSQKLRVPKISRRIRVTCPRCKRQTVITGKV
jgi:hypothetical protein